jgi:hypothetical protein
MARDERCESRVLISLVSPLLCSVAGVRMDTFASCADRAKSAVSVRLSRSPSQLSRSFTKSRSIDLIPCVDAAID